MSHSKFSIWLEATRPKTLPAAVVPVCLGTAMAYQVGALQVLPAVICLAFALLVQIGTNFANDYLDGIRGTDTEARLGPQRAVASGQVRPATMRWAAMGVLAAAFCLGLSLIAFGGWWLLLIGIASVACAWMYTGGPYPLAYNGLGDVFVVLFFGWVAVGFTFFVQAGYFSPEVLWLGTGCGLVINNLLVVNNYRDMEEDRQANKRTLVVMLGRRWALVQYGGSLFIAGCVYSWLAYRGYGALLWLGWLPVFGGWILLWKLPQARSRDDYTSALKGAAALVVLYGALGSLGLWVG
jgi:1,4-dihydroxy-2-naphthoate octaprenyltransferase